MKERIREILSSFFISVTLINVGIFILGEVFRPEQRFGYEAYIYPLIYGAIGVIPTCLVTIKKELSIKQVIIRKCMQLLLLIVLLLAFMFAGNPVDAETLSVAGGVALSIVLIYILVNVIIWLMDSRTARIMTEDLMRFQEKEQE